MVSDTHLKTYKHLGVNINPGANGEATANCPFCKEDKFSINTEEGLFYCFNPACEEKGNKYTFLKRWYETCLDRTRESKLKRLSKDRQLPIEAFTNCKVAYDSTNSRWIIPVPNHKGSMVNLRIWSEEERIMKNIAGCKSHLYNQDLLINRDSSITKVYICEGEWDVIAFSYFLSQTREKNYCVVGVPGAAAFKKEWCEYFTGLDVILVFDNDEAGDNGSQKTASLLQESDNTNSLSWVVWPEDLPNKFDIRDYVVNNLEKPKSSFRKLKKYIEEVPQFSKTSIDCKDFPSLISHFKKHIYMSKDMEEGMLLVCAVVASNKIPGDPLWLFIVGPPGGGKTLLLQSCAKSQEVEFQSSLGAKTLISGFKTTSGS